MASRREYLSPEIVNRGIEESGPYAGSPSFSIRVRRGLPDFLSSVNLKYVRLGYGYLINHGIGFCFVAAPVFVVLMATLSGKLHWNDFYLKFEVGKALVYLGFLCLAVCVYLDFTPRTTYLVDFACRRPPNTMTIKDLVNSNKKSERFSQITRD